jgi:hypothetical protein
MADDPLISLIDLPQPWLGQLFQQLACGPRGLKDAAALSLTCKSLCALSKSPALTYHSIYVDHKIRSGQHPFWQWLGQREGRVKQLDLHVEVMAPRWGQPQPNWEGPIQLLASVAECHLSLGAGGCWQSVMQWLDQGRQLIKKLTITHYGIDEA